MKYNTYKTRLAGQSFPYACLDKELFYQNIATNLKRSGDKKIRIASKSIRCTEVMRMILDYDQQFQGVMTYHGREALFLLQESFDDLLMGYPIVELPLLHQLGEAVKKGKTICLMADHENHLAMINEVGVALKTPMPVCLDIDLSDNYPGLRFGVWRSSLTSVDALASLLAKLPQFPYVRIEGMMGYEAQIAGVGDQLVGYQLKSQVIHWLKKRSIPRLQKRRQEAVDLIHAQGIKLRFVNGGGTGSLESTCQEDTVTEVTVGSGFYNSHLFDYYRNFQLQPALFYAIPIVREAVAGVYTCHGGGFIASGGVEASKAPQVYLPDGGILDPLEGAGEVQTPIRFKDKQVKLAIGDPVFLRHAKAGELCERFNQIILLEETGLRELPTYRGQGQSFG
jgi:D-serine deaminase-like pyridoxal phosphate-dependent protein